MQEHAPNETKQATFIYLFIYLFIYNEYLYRITVSKISKLCIYLQISVVKWVL